MRGGQRATVQPAAIYRRVSLDKHHDEQGVARQGDDCLNLARKRSWDVVKTITDNDQSAKRSGKREGFAQLLRDIDAGLVKVVVAWNL